MNIYIHGLIGSPSNWSHVTQNILGNNVCLNIDYTEPLNEQLETIKSTIDKENIDICVANSLGCLVSLQIADKCKQLILVSPPYKFLKGGAFMSEKRIKELSNELFFDSSKVPKLEMEETIKKWNSRFKTQKTMRELKNLKKELLSFDFKKYYSLYEDKIHFVLGREDKYVPVDEFLKMMKETCPKAQVTIVDKCAHAVQIEKPQVLIDVIAKVSKRY